jgi:hypothetical protein
MNGLPGIRVLFAPFFPEGYVVKSSLSQDFTLNRTAAVSEGPAAARDLLKERCSRFTAWPVAGGKLLCASSHILQLLHNNLVSSKNFAGHRRPLRD